MKLNLTLNTRVSLVNVIASVTILIVGLVIRWQFIRVEGLVQSTENFDLAIRSQLEIAKGQSDLKANLFHALQDVTAHPENLEEISKNVKFTHRNIANSYTGLKNQLTSQPDILSKVEANQARSESLSQSLLAALKDPTELQTQSENLLKDVNEADVALNEIGRDLETHRSNARSESGNLFDLAKSIISGVLILGILLLVGGSFFFVRALTAPIRSVINTLSVGAEQFGASARLVSSAGQHLAMGASQQAASLEEASASLEEIASMTKNNADNAQKTSLLVGQTREAMEASMDDMKQMNVAMDAIKASSDSISKIIKTIDEISFQTNILALNAAVEAARAGEAGMGFAVVAEEVRNLAQHSAKAASDTAEKIEDSIKKSEQAIRASSKVTEKLGSVMKDIRQVDELVAEITSASKEQSLGIEQINLAVNQIDEGTQSTAANAEESASAAEQLNAQAAELEAAVNELVKLVGNERVNEKTDVAPEKTAGVKSSTIIASAYKPKTRITRVPEDPKKIQRRNGTGSHLLEREKGDDIPMDQHFKDF